MNTGAFGENFPYSNFHDLNMDWIIRIAKDFLDQYTHIQEIIANGEASLQNLTGDGLEQLQEKADALEALLQAWYDTHSNDIQTELADALQDINNTLTSTIAEFRVNANAIAAETIASIPADYSSLSTGIRELKNLITGSVNLYGYFDIDRGTINARTGVPSSAAETNRARTPFLPKTIHALETSGIYQFAVYAYQQDGTYVGALDENGNWTTAPLEVFYMTYYTFPNTYKYRIVFKNVTDTDFGTYELYQFISFFTATDTSLTKTGTPADAKSTGDRLSELIVGKPEYLTIMYLDEFSNFNLGAINGSGEIDTSYTRSLYSEEFEIHAGDIAILNCVPVRTVALDPTSLRISINYYNANHTFISRVIGGANISHIEGTAPEGSQYVRISLTQALALSLRNFYFTIKMRNPLLYTNLISHTTNLHIIGDSISAGYYSITDEEAEEQGVEIYYRPTGLDGVGAVWDTSLNHNYWGYANKVLGFNIINHSYPATGYLRLNAQDNNAMTIIDTDEFDDADIIVFALGVNDWHYKMVRGNHTPLAETPVNTPRSAITTVNQAIWYSLGKAIQKAPNATIIVQLPMNAWLYGGDFSTNWGMNHSLTRSGTLKEISDDIKYWADYYGLQILDLSNNNSTINRMNIKTSELDGSHPTDLAHRQIGHKVAQALLYR